MPGLKRLVAEEKPRRLTFELGGEECWVDVRGSHLTTQNVLDLSGPSTAPEERVRIIAELVVDWNLLERDPEPGEDEADVPRVPHTFDWFMSGEGSASVAGLIIQAMQEAAELGEAKPPSAAG